MGFFDDIINGLNALANLKKADAEQIKAKNQKDRMRKLSRENKALKKDLSTNKTIGIVSVVLAAIGIIITVFFVYFPVKNSP